jgi:hypothetical protein
MFAPPDRLAFDLAELIEQTVAEWSEIKEAGLIRPEAETYGDYIASELTARNLRQVDPDTDDALFDAYAPVGRFREVIIAALDRWLIESEIRPNTPKEAEDYNRPLGE